MSKYDYYTPRELAQTLLQLIPSNAPIAKIADICCGTWNLLTAAHSRFPNAELTGVDINEKVIENAIQDASFFAKDGRDFANEMDEKGVHFDLLLSNPPFGTLSDSQKKYSGKECVQNFKRYESELLYANYLLLNTNGYLLVILPVTYARGHQYKSHRIWIAQNFNVLNIVDLPINTFGNKSLHTVALVLRKSKVAQVVSTTLYIAKLNHESWSLDKSCNVDPLKIASGDWLADNDASAPGIDIFRGSISSQYFSKIGEPVLHCSSVFTNGVWKPAIRNCAGIKESQKKYAESGDVLINRVGRNAAAWIEYSGPTCLISDCIIVIKHPTEAILNKLIKHSNIGILQISRLGVSTPYVSSTEIINLLSQAD